MPNSTHLLIKMIRIPFFGDIVQFPRRKLFGKNQMRTIFRPMSETMNGQKRLSIRISSVNDPPSRQFDEETDDAGNEKDVSKKSSNSDPIYTKKNPEIVQFDNKYNLVQTSAGVVVLVSVSRINGSDGTISVKYRTIDRIYLSCSYCHELESILLFGPGEVHKDIVINVTTDDDDSDSNQDKIFDVELFDPTGGAIIPEQGRTSTVVITKVDDDSDVKFSYGKVLKAVLTTTAIGAGTGVLALGGGAFLIGAAGFGAGGVAEGSLAASYQSSTLVGTIAKGSAFSVLQSIGAGGFATSTKATVVLSCIAATAAIRGFVAKRQKKIKET